MGSSTSPAASSEQEQPSRPEHAEPPEQRSTGQQGYDHTAVPPLDVTGVRTVAIGTGLWLVAFLVLVPFRSAMSEHGRGWWLWTCAAGIGLGLVGLEYCRRRRTRLAKQPPRPVETSPFGAAGL
ncbi:MAG: DUF2530 domain-containing protein [Propionibacteriales bacterium]|nr:DUF2530 domain-containing protein [Propionibacteriales bacterium]